MGTTLEALLRLQSVEHELTQVRRRLNTRRNAVAAREKQIHSFQEKLDALSARLLDRRKAADQSELDLKQKEERVVKLRGSLNLARTNKEYAAILTEINTFKADNAKIEEQALKIMQDIDAVKKEIEGVRQQMQAEEKRLEQIRQENAAEIARLNGLLEDLSRKRAEAAKAVPGDALALFERIAESLGGEVMAVIEVQGKKPPHTYVCGGCFMGLNAEHANVLRYRDEVRTCGNCGRILYLQPLAEGSRTE